MATGTVILPILAGVPDAVSPPALLWGTGTSHPYLAFDNVTDEVIRWTFRLPTDYASAPVLQVQWSNSTTATGNAVWACAIAKVTPNSDADDMVAVKVPAAANNQADAGVGTRQLQEVAITLSNFDGATAGDWIMLELFVDTTASTITEDCLLWAASLEYTTS